MSFRKRDKQKWTTDRSGEIESHLAAIAPNNPVRSIATVLLVNSTTYVGSIEPLLDALVDSRRSRWRERIVAAWSLGRISLSEEANQNAARILAEVLRDTLPPDARRVWKGYWRLVLVALAGAVLSGILVDSITPEEAPDALAILFMGFGAMALCFFLAMPAHLLARSVASRDGSHNLVRLEATRTLGILVHPPSVGALARALFDHSEAIREAAHQALLVTLAQITYDHLGELGSSTVPDLASALACRDENLVLKVLEALEKIGDARALPQVARLAAGAGWSEVGREAARVRDILMERKWQDLAPERLVRPSFPPGMTPDSLVSPADTSLQPARYRVDVLPPDEVPGEA